MTAVQAKMKSPLMPYLLPLILKPRIKWLLVPLLAITTTACSPPMQYSIDQSAIRDNPNPRQKYEVVVTSAAPGPWDSVQGYVGYTVTNVKCVPQLPLEGAREVPNTGRKFKLTSTDGGKTWIGYFYRYMIQDEDYFGLGVCHWDVESVGPSFYVHGEVFGPGVNLQEMLVPKTYTSYFKKVKYFNKEINGDLQALEWPMGDEESRREVAKDPDAFFPMTITVKKVTP
jgi:hypothetical protein